MARKPRGSIVTRFFVKVRYTDENGTEHETTLRAKSKAQAQQLKRDAVKRWPKAKASITPKLYARVRYTEAGQPREFMRAADSRADAQEQIDELLNDRKTERKDKIEELIAVIAELKAARDPSTKTFGELVRYYEETELIPAQFNDAGQQDVGLRSLKPALSAIKPLKAHFGDRLLREITYSDIRDYKRERLATPTRSNKKRSYASVHRELSKLRRMFKLAIEKEWLEQNPFAKGKPLIQAKLENKRNRVLSLAEERRLLSVCTDRRAHLKPILLCAVDTAMRRGEILKLRWRDVDLEAGVIVIDAQHTKTLQRREVGITIRLREELTRLYAEADPGPDWIVFGIKDNFTSSWESARAAAGLADPDPQKTLRWHDFRHTTSTRWIECGIPLPIVTKLMGHSEGSSKLGLLFDEGAGSKVTWRYINIGAESAKRAAAALDHLYAEYSAQIEPTPESGMVN